MIQKYLGLQYYPHRISAVWYTPPCENSLSPLGLNANASTSPFIFTEPIHSFDYSHHQQNSRYTHKNVSSEWLDIPWHQPQSRPFSGTFPALLMKCILHFLTCKNTIILQENGFPSQCYMMTLRILRNV